MSAVGAAQELFLRVLAAFCPWKPIPDLPPHRAKPTRVGNPGLAGSSCKGPVRARFWREWVRCGPAAQGMILFQPLSLRSSRFAALISGKRSSQANKPQGISWSLLFAALLPGDRGEFCTLSEFFVIEEFGFTLGSSCACMAGTGAGLLCVYSEGTDLNSSTFIHTQR